MLSRTLLKALAVVLLSTFLSAQGVGGKAGLGGKAGFGGGASGGAASISHIADTTCYPATICAATSVVSGDLLLVFVGDNAVSSTTTVTGNNCSSQGSGTSFQGGANQAIGAWCIANSTTVTFTGGGSCIAGNDCGLEVLQFRSTTGFAGASFLHNEASLTFASNSNTTFAPVTTTASVNVVASYLLDESGQATYTATSPWTSAGTAGATHNDIAGWQVNLAAATYSPSFTSTPTAAPLGNMGITLAMAAN